MKKAAMNRKKRLDAPSKQEVRERYESARRQNAKEDANEERLSSTSELPKRPREDPGQDIQAQSSDLRDKLPKLSRTIAGNDETGSLVLKTDHSASLSLVDPSYDDNKMSVEMFDYSHKRSDTDPVEDDGDDLRTLIERQRRNETISKKDDKHSKKTDSTFLDSMIGYSKDQSKSKTTEDYRDKRKENKDGKTSSGKSDRYTKHDGKSKSKKDKDKSMSSFELGFPFFSGDSGSKNAKNTDKPTEEMDINETLKELAYLRSIQTGDNALPKEEEEYFRKLNDLSMPILSSQLDQNITGTDAGKHRKKSFEKAEGGTKTLGENMSKIESKWDSVIDSMVSTKPVGNTTSSDEITYGPSLPPKKSTSTSKKVKDIDSPEKRFSKERSSSKSKSDQQLSPKSERGVRGGRGFRGRGVRGSFRGRGGGRGRGGKEFVPGMRGRGRSRGRFVRGGFVPSRGRHMFAKQGGSRRRSRSRSSSRSSSSSRSRSRSRSRGRSSTKRRRRRSSSRSSYSSSSYSSRSRSRSRDRGKGKKQTKKRSRSRSYSSRSRSRSRSRNRSRSYSRSTTHSKSRKRSKSRSRSKESYKKQNKGRARSRSRSKSSSTSRSRKRKDRSRSWSFDEDYTKKKNAKSTLNTSGTKTTNNKTRREQEPKIQSKPKKEKTEMGKAKPSKVFEPKLVQSNQVKGKTPVKIPENAPEKTYYERPKAENSNSPAVVPLKDLKVTAFSNVFLPRTVSKTVGGGGGISKGISIGKGRSLPLKKHPVFDNTEEDLQEEPEKLDPKELERMKEEKHRFDKEVDKVFNAKADSKDVDKKKGGWKRVGPPEESLKEETQEQKKAELGETKYEEIEEKKAVEDQRIVESKETVEEKKTDKEQKKEKKGKRRKDKEERNKRKKEKKEKKEKKNKESTNQESLGNENKEKALGDDGQPVLDSSTPQQYNQEGYSGYDEATQEYPEGEYQYYEETAQEQGWYDENGVYHPYEEEEYLYYYDQEGNIVGYEGPEGYVEGNPFEEQQYYYEGETQEGVHPEVYEQEAYGTEYTGDAEGSYQYGAPDFPVEGQAVQPEQYTGADSQWEQYATDAPEQQWYNAEGAYPVEEQGYAEYQYAKGQEGANQYAGALEQQVPIQQDANYMVQQGGIPETYAAPVQAVEEPKTEGDLCENEIVLALGKNLAALARLKGWNQQELLEKDPINLVQMLQKPSVEKSGVEAHRETQPQEAREQFELERQLEIETNRQVIPERKPDKVPRQHPQERNLNEVRMPYPREGKPGINNSRAKPAEQKPLKSILKKRNSSSLKPPSKTETSAASPFKSDPSAATSDHVGPEYIVRISKSGPERFFCKLCQCHIESPMAKELHVKSMKHIELFVREKSSLLNSVIGTKQSEDTAMPNEIPESGDESGFSQQDKLAEKGEPSPDKKDYPERRDTPEEDPVRNRLLDYDRLRLMDWHRREGSVSSVESDKIKQFDHGRIEEQDFESRTPGVQMSVEQEGYEDKIEHSRRPRERREADLRKDEQGYGRERQHYAPEIRERDYETRDYHRERRSLSHDSDHRDDRGSVGSRSSDRSEKDSRLEHKVPPMAHRNRMQQDVRPSVRDRPGINQGEGSNNQRERVRGGTQREQPSRPEQVSGRDRSDRSRLNQNERERSRRDASGQGRGRTSFPPQENRGQAPQDRWHGQASRQDTTITKQDSDQKVQEVSSHPTGSSRMPSSDRKEMPRTESTGLGRERRAEQSVKPNERVSESSSVVERNKAQQSQNTSKDNDSNRKTATGLEVDRDPGRVGVKPLPRIQNQKLAQERRAQESQQQVPGSTAKPTSASLLGDAPRSQTEEQQPQEEVKSISTVIPGQRRVPPPPPPYNKGSGPQSFRGRGHPPPPRGRGGHHSHMPPNQPGIMGSDAPPHSFSMPPQVTSHEVGAPSSGVPPGKLFPGDQSMGNHPTPPFYGRGRAAGQQRGRGGSPHMSRGGYGGRPQFATRGRGGRGFHGQRW